MGGEAAPHPFPFLSSPDLTVPLFIAAGGPRIRASYAALPAPRSAWPCAPELAAAAYLRRVSLAPAAFAPRAFRSVGGGFCAPHPSFSAAPRPARDSPPPPRWSSRRRRRAAGRWLRSGRSSCGTRGRTSSWAAPAPVGVRRAGRTRGGAEVLRATPAGHWVPPAWPQLPSRVPGVRPPCRARAWEGAESPV